MELSTSAETMIRRTLKAWRPYSKRRPEQLSISPLRDVSRQPVKLLEEVVLVDPLRAFEKAGEVAHRAFAAAPLLQVREAGEVDTQGGGEQAVATLPCELEGHLGAQKALEV